MESYASLQTLAEKLPAAEWINVVGRSLTEPVSLSGVALPGGPSVELQAAYVGNSGQQAMHEAGLFYRYALDSNQQHRDAPISRLLDFGCGWGRYTRLFVRDVPEDGLYGVDPDPVAVQACRSHVHFGCFVNSSPRPPLPFRDQFFDVAIAYSVFSHLLEIAAANWIGELSRVLRPGGLLIATTHPIWLLDLVMELQDGTTPSTMPWHETLVKSWPNVAEARARFERGEFVAPDTGEYPFYESYGDVLVPERYVREVWGRIMEPLEYVSDSSRLGQAAFVLRRRP